MAAKDQSLVQTENALPAFLQERMDTSGAQAGLENVEADDFVLPRLYIVQHADQLGDGDYKLGQIVNTVTGEVVGSEKDPVTFIPCLFMRQRRKWTPRDSGEKRTECESLDGKTARVANGLTVAGQPTNSCADCRYKDWEGDSPPVCTEYLSFPAGLLLDGPDGELTPCVIDFDRTRHKQGKRLITLAKMFQGGKLPLFACRYSIHSEKTKNAKGQSYYVFNVKQVGIANEQQFNAAEALYDSMKDRDITVADEMSGGDAAPSSNGSMTEVNSSVEKPVDEF